MHQLRTFAELVRRATARSTSVQNRPSGATLATRYAATQHVPDLRGLVCLGNPWGLPQSMQRRADR